MQTSSHCFQGLITRRRGRNAELGQPWGDRRPRSAPKMYIRADLEVSAGEEVSHGANRRAGIPLRADELRREADMETVMQSVLD
ncbi:hypothetical protein DL767_002936 [Monosporascus sp. MG133]|nr:hypothetical protein DL767_002936 [Monosporascus sp. MG133]